MRPGPAGQRRPEHQGRALTATRALLVVGVPDAQRLAAACVLARIDATVVPLEGTGSAVVLDDAARAGDASERLSRMLGNADVLLLTRGEDEVAAELWRGGAVTDAPAPGLVLARLPATAERLLLGTRAPADVEGAASTRGMSRLAAARAAVAGTPAEAAWASRTQRWTRLLVLVAIGVLAALVVLQVVLTASGDGSPILLGLALAALGLLVVRAIRRRRAP